MIARTPRSKTILNFTIDQHQYLPESPTAHIQTTPIAPMETMAPDPHNPVSKEMQTHIEAGDLDAVKKLYGEWPAAQRNELSQFIAQQAAYRDRAGILEWCLDHTDKDAEPLATHWFYNYACWGASTAVWTLLLDRGYDISKQGYSESVGDPLVQAGIHGNAELATLLIERAGVDPNSGYSSIHSEETAAIGAIQRDLEPAGDGDGGLAYDEDEDEDGALARELEQVDPPDRWTGAESAVPVLRALLRGGWRGAAAEGALIVAAEAGHLAALRVLAEEDPAVDLEAAVHWWGSSSGASRVGTALYRAALRGRVEAVRYLLQRGADPSAKDVAGRPCLFAAREGGEQAVVKLLEQVGQETR
ncbi:hypothetical protein RB598_007334 [Gaeumannomyces tritici]